MATTLVQELQKAQMAIDYPLWPEQEEWGRRRKAEIEALLRSSGAAPDVELFEDEVDRFVGLRVKIARQLKGKKQSDLAAGVGLSQKQVSHVEQGVRSVSVPELIRIAIELGRPIAFFVDPDGKHEVRTGWEKS